MSTAPAREDHAAPFRMSPDGPGILRDYSHDDPAALTDLRGLLGEILTRHKDLVPGQLHRSVIQWHADVHRAVEAAGTPGSGDGR